MTTKTCKRCGLPVIAALSANGEVIHLDPQLSAFGSYRLASGPDELAFAIRDPGGVGQRYTGHDGGGSCRGMAAQPPASHQAAAEMA